MWHDNWPQADTHLDWIFTFQLSRTPETTPTKLQPLKVTKLYLLTVWSLNMEEEQKEQLKPWHRKALIAGRKPLPDTAGVRPWIPYIKVETKEETEARERQEKALKRKVCSTMSPEPSYKWPSWLFPSSISPDAELTSAISNGPKPNSSVSVVYETRIYHGKRWKQVESPDCPMMF